MDIRGNDFIYEVVPPFMNNRQLPPEQQVWFELQGVSQEDADLLERQTQLAISDLSRDKAVEKIAELNLNQIKGKFKAAHNLEISGQAVTTFDDFYKKAPRELVQWAIRTIHSTQALNEAERKNFLPGSDLAS